MKLFRNALILVIVAALAGFFYWFFEIKKKREKEAREEKDALLFEESDKKVVKLTLATKGSESIELEWKPKKPALGEEAVEEESDEEQGEWSVTAPIKTGGDTMMIDSIVGSLLQGSRESVIWDSLEKEEEYGLKDPAYSLHFYYEGESTLRGIDFGIESLDKKKIFAKVIGQERIFAIPAGLLDSVKKSLFDVRDKRLAPIDKEDITGISIMTGLESLILIREEEDWFLLPDKVKASNARVEMYTGNLRWDNFVQVMEEESKNFVRYGLDKPRIIVTFMLNEDEVFLFVVGDSITEGEAEFFYATRTSDNIIFQMKSETVQKLVTTKFHLKDRTIFDWKTEQVNVLTLDYDGKSYSFEKEDDDWKLTGLDPTDGNQAYIGQVLSRGYKLDNIIRGISTAEYEFRDPVKRGDPDYEETGIDNPEYIVSMEFADDGERLTVSLTQKEQETGKLFMTPDGGDTVYYISGYFDSSFPETLDELFD
jgi:hypothetical protein